MASRLEIYRSRAEQCEAVAAAATEPNARRTFTALAKEWRNLARQLETLKPEDAAEQ